MKLNKKEFDFLNQTLAHWKKEELLTPDDISRLENSYGLQKFDWNRLARYSFFIAMACGIVSFSSIFMDEELIERIGSLFTQSDLGICITCLIIASVIYMLGYRRQKKSPEKAYSNEVILLIATLFTTASIVYLGKILDTGSGHYSILILICALVYAALGLFFKSPLLWLFTLLALGGWFGAETGYISGWGAYYLGMNYPLRFVAFGSALIIASFLFDKTKLLKDFQHLTFTLGLLYLFIALWILSIFGNHGDWSIWADTKQIQLFHWSILFGLASIGTIYYGIKAENRTARGFGITFIFINIYTRYFEYFWDISHKTIFFSIIALSFWFIGRKAETIWNLDFIKKK